MCSAFVDQRHFAVRTQLPPVLQIAPTQKRQVEGPTIEGHRHTLRTKQIGHRRQQCALFPWMAHEELTHHKLHRRTGAACLEDAHTHHEGIDPSAAAQPGRLRVYESGLAEAALHLQPKIGMKGRHRCRADLQQVAQDVAATRRLQRIGSGYHITGAQGTLDNRAGRKLFQSARARWRAHR